MQVSEYVRINIISAIRHNEIRRELAEMTLNRKLFHHIGSRAVWSG